MNSNQKSSCERNHEFIRYIIPKKTAKERYTEEEVRLMMNHISLRRQRILFSQGSQTNGAFSYPAQNSSR